MFFGGAIPSDAKDFRHLQYHGFINQQSLRLSCRSTNIIKYRNPSRCGKAWNLWNRTESPKSQMSNEKDPGYLLCTGDYTTQLCGDYNAPHIRIPIK